MGEHVLRIDDAWTLRVEANRGVFAGAHNDLALTVQGDDARAIGQLHRLTEREWGVALYPDGHDESRRNGRQYRGGIRMGMDDHAGMRVRIV